MYHLPVPALSVEQVYPNCAARTRNRDLRKALLLEGARVLLRAEVYSERAQHQTLHEMAPEAAEYVTGTQLSALYERVLVNGSERHVYDSIRSLGRFRRCPLCTQRDIRTLDHYLPRAAFPEFAVLPMNLVPSCFECNHVKLDHVPATFHEQMFHPYFDDWEHLEIVYASVRIEDTVYAEFQVKDEGLPVVVAARAATHFKRLELATLYSEHATVELVQRRADFIEIYEADGSLALRQELLRESNSRRAPFPNAWQPVLYRALALSDEFINGGFYSIEG